MLSFLMGQLLITLKQHLILFYLTAIFMIVYVALLYLHEHYLKYKYKDLFIRIMSNSNKDKHP